MKRSLTIAVLLLLTTPAAAHDFWQTGETKGGLLALQMTPNNMPAAELAYPFNYSDLFG